MKHYSRVFDVVENKDCGCIASIGIDDQMCLKRYYLVHDIIKGKRYYLSVCNEYLRLLIHNSAFKHEWDHGIRKAIEHVIFTKMERPKLNEKYKISSDNDLLNQNIHYSLCDRPNITGAISVLQACEVVANDSMNFELSDYVIDHFDRYYKECRYKKYKTMYRDAALLAQKVRRTYGDSRRVAVNDFLIHLLNLKTKNK